VRLEVRCDWIDLDGAVWRVEFQCRRTALSVLGLPMLPGGANPAGLRLPLAISASADRGRGAGHWPEATVWAVLRQAQI
jgi:hypothetical protein